MKRTLKWIFPMAAFLLLAAGCTKSEDSTNNSTTGDVTDVDGNNYHSVTIGSQVWLSENLKTTKYRDGSPISLVSSESEWSKLTTSAYCNFNNDVNNVAVYGRLYNFFAVADSRGIAPSGWHVATDADWTTLSNFLGGEVLAGGKMKETGTSHWQSVNTGATNETGFTALPGGMRHSSDGSFGQLGGYGYWWTSTENDVNTAMMRSLYYNDTEVHHALFDKQPGFSVRCIKD